MLPSHRRHCSCGFRVNFSFNKIKSTKWLQGGFQSQLLIGPNSVNWFQSQKGQSLMHLRLDQMVI